MPFTLEGLKELKNCVNSMIGTRYEYLYSDNISDKEQAFTKKKLAENYDLLATLLKLIGEEESK